MWVAAITAVPGTIGAVLAFLAARRGKRTESHAVQINRAVNHQPSNEPTLIMIVKSIDSRVGGLELGQLEQSTKLREHIVWHQAQGGTPPLDAQS